MPVVLTIDQRQSRSNPDRIGTWVKMLNNERTWQLRLPFVRTAGDEMQALVDDPEGIIEMVLLGVRHRAWWVGIGIGSVDLPLGETAANSRGDAFYKAREAVTEAKNSPYGFAVSGGDQAHAVSASLMLLAHIARRRGRRQWEAVDMAREGLSQKTIGEQLGITPQAVSQRLHAAAWQEEREGRWLAHWLLSPLVGIDA